MTAVMVGVRPLTGRTSDWRTPWNECQRPLAHGGPHQNTGPFSPGDQTSQSTVVVSFPFVPGPLPSQSLPLCKRPMKHAWPTHSFTLTWTFVILTIEMSGKMVTWLMDSGVCVFAKLRSPRVVSWHVRLQAAACWSYWTLWAPGSI